MNQSSSFDWATLLAEAPEPEALAWIASQTRESLDALRDKSASHSVTPLMIAAKRSAQLTQALIPLSDVEERSRPHNQTAMMIAAGAGRTDCVEFLVPVSDANAASTWGYTALLTAIGQGREDCARILASKSNLSQRDKQGRTALMTACESGVWGCVPFLSNAITASEIHEQTNSTPLIMIADAARGSEADRLKALAHVLPFSDASVLNGQERSAFQLAIYNSQWALALAIGKATDILDETGRWSPFDELLRNGEHQPHPQKDAVVAQIAKILAADGQLNRVSVAFGKAVNLMLWECAEALSEWATPQQLQFALEFAATRKAEDRVQQITSRCEAVELQRIVDANARNAAIAEMPSPAAHSLATPFLEKEPGGESSSQTDSRNEKEPESAFGQRNQNEKKSPKKYHQPPRI